MNINRNPLLLGIAQSLAKRNATGNVERALAYAEAKRELVLKPDATREEAHTLIDAFLDEARAKAERVEVDLHFDRLAEGDQQEGDGDAEGTETGNEPTQALPAKKTIIQRSPAGEIRYESHACYTGNHDAEASASEALSIDELDKYAVWTREEGSEAAQNRLQHAVATSLRK